MQLFSKDIFGMGEVGIKHLIIFEYAVTTFNIKLFRACNLMFTYFLVIKKKLGTLLILIHDMLGTNRWYE